MFQVQIGDAFTLGEDPNAGIKQSSAYTDIGTFLSNILPNIFVIANLILFFLILFGGFILITNSGNADKQKQGSTIITAALIGYFVIFASYWIMQILGILTGYGFLRGIGITL